MQINGMGGVSTYNTYAQANSAKAMKSVPLSKFGGWGAGTIATRTETDRTDDEIKNSIIELAKQDALRGVHGGSIDNFGTHSKEFDKLIGEYITSVSPDRQAIYTAGISQMGKATSLKGITPFIDDFFTQLLFNGSKVNLKNTGVMYDAKSKMMEINHVEFFVGGERIGAYDMGRGWDISLTKEEQSRNEEINRLYTKVWADERKQIETGNK